VSIYARESKALKNYKLFISHAWRYTKGYTRLVGLLDEAPRFRWSNFSAPRSKPLLDPDVPGSRATLIGELRDQIRPVHCVLIVSGMYASYSYWIGKEMEVAKEYGKPIVAVRPWGAQRTPAAVVGAADELVNWQTGSIVAAIRRQAL
jgi:hypothetical protein